MITCVHCEKKWFACSCVREIALHMTIDDLLYGEGLQAGVEYADMAFTHAEEFWTNPDFFEPAKPLGVAVANPSALDLQQGACGICGNHGHEHGKCPPETWDVSAPACACSEIGPCQQCSNLDQDYAAAMGQVEPCSDCDEINGHASWCERLRLPNARRPVLGGPRKLFSQDEPPPWTCDVCKGTSSTCTCPIPF